MIARLLAWWHRNDHLAHHATQAAIRQEMELHPAEKGDHHDIDLPLVPTSRPAAMQDVRTLRVPPTRDRSAYQTTWPTR